MTTKTQIAEMLIEYQRVQKQANYLKYEITKYVLEHREDVEIDNISVEYHLEKDIDVRPWVSFHNFDTVYP